MEKQFSNTQNVLQKGYYLEQTENIEYYLDVGH